MSLRIIGPPPLEVNAEGDLESRIGTVFLQQETLFTASPWVHAMQRAAFLDILNGERIEKSTPPLSLEEEIEVSTLSVDLIFEPGRILIRPDPARMDLSFLADELLQDVVWKRKIRFLSVADSRVREAIQRRGENWRLAGIPTTLEEKRDVIFNSRVAIRGLAIYFFNRLTGTRWLTLRNFESLGKLEPAQLALHLDEITSYLSLTNRLGKPELSFFATDLGGLDKRNFTSVPWLALPPGEVRDEYERILKAFHGTVHESYRIEECDNKPWCDRMLSTLFLEGNDSQSETSSKSLSPEFFAQIRWVPGGRIEDGEFILDRVLEEEANEPEQAAGNQVCDEPAKGIIYNFLREYGDLEFINVGLVTEPLNKKRPQKEGRRGVYIAEFQSQSHPGVIRKFLRLQKWDVTEHLGQGKDLLTAILESDEYTEYWLNRRLGARQLGMSVNRRVSMHRLTEHYRKPGSHYDGWPIHTTYFEREFLDGTASDKIKPEKYDIPGYPERLANLLGCAAAASMIVGRALKQVLEKEGGVKCEIKPVFDDGDELVVEGEDGLPENLFVADHSGSFALYKEPLESFAWYYARPVNARSRFVKNLKVFGEIYTQALRRQLEHAQEDYRKRRRAFDNLFRHFKYDRGGSFAYRWECVLKRLDSMDVDRLVAAVRTHISVFQPPASGLQNTPAAH